MSGIFSFFCIEKYKEIGVIIHANAKKRVKNHSDSSLFVIHSLRLHQCARKFHLELSVLKSHSANVGVLSAIE